MKRLLPILLLALAAACDGDPSGPARREVNLGDVLTLNVNADSLCSNPINREARVVALSEHSAVLADVSNPANGFTTADYQQFADEFERVVWPTDTRNFGEPSDIDRNGRVLIFFTSAVNELTPRGAGFVVGGFFYARDIYPKRAQNPKDNCEGSNEGELFYLLAPDPAGTINGNARSLNSVRTSTFGTIAHEFQHLINASRRLYENDASRFEERWLDEGLAHIAEELSFYAASGLEPRQNILLNNTFFPNPTRIEALNRYQTANLGRLNEYYDEPTLNSPIFSDNQNNDLATRGSAWSFLRYTADQTRASNERDFWFALVNNTETGIANLSEVCACDPLPLFQNWGVTNYTDDAGIANIPALYTHPSWHFRQVLSNPALGGFKLEVDTLVNGAPRQLDMAPLSNAYLRLGVAAGGRAELRITGPGAQGTGSCIATPVGVGQVVQRNGAAASALCLDGGDAGAEYTVIPFYASTANQRAPVSVVANGIVRPTSPPNPSVSPVGPTLARAAAEAGAGGADGGFETRLREREQALHARFGRGAVRSVSAAQQTNEIRVSVVRTK